MAVKVLQISPLPTASNSAVDFGVQIENVDLETLSDEDFDLIRNAVYNHHVVVLKGQQGLSPKAQYELTRRFDPASDNYGHGKTLDAKRYENIPLPSHYCTDKLVAQFCTLISRPSHTNHKCRSLEMATTRNTKV